VPLTESRNALGEAGFEGSFRRGDRTAVIALQLSHRSWIRPGNDLAGLLTYTSANLSAFPENNVPVAKIDPAQFSVLTVTG
jgi:hypothetical protein